MGQHLQAEGRRDTATDTGDPSPFKELPARAVQLDTSDNHPFSRRHGTETGSAQRTGSPLDRLDFRTDRHGRSIGQSQSMPRRPFPKQAYDTDANRLCPRRCCWFTSPHARHGAALPVGLLPKHKRCQMADAAVRCDTELPHKHIRLRSIYKTIVHMRCTIRAGIARSTTQLQTHHKHRVPLKSKLQVVIRQWFNQHEPSMSGLMHHSFVAIFDPAGHI